MKTLLIQWIHATDSNKEHFAQKMNIRIEVLISNRNSGVSTKTKNIDDDDGERFF